MSLPDRLTLRVGRVRSQAAFFVVGIVGISACATSVPQPTEVEACQGYVMQSVQGGPLSDGLVLNTFGDGCRPDDPGMHVLTAGPPGGSAADVQATCKSACETALQTYVQRVATSGFPSTTGMGCLVTGYSVCTGRSGGPVSGTSVVPLNGGPADHRVVGLVTSAQAGVSMGRGAIDYTCVTPACTMLAVTSISAGDATGMSTIESNGTPSANATPTTFSLGAANLEGRTMTGAWHVTTQGSTITGTLSAAGAVTINDANFQFTTDATGVAHRPTLSITASAAQVECTAGGAGQVELTATAADADSDLASVLWFDATGAVIPTTLPNLALSLSPGTKVLRVLAQDRRGAMVAGSTTVVVHDAVKPVIQPPAMVTTSPCLSTTLTAPLVSDNCATPAQIALTSNVANPSQFALGTTTVTWTATDTAGNQSTALQTVLSQNGPACYPAADTCATPKIVAPTAGMPFHDAIDLTLLSASSTDPVQACATPSGSRTGRTVWYQFTPTLNGTLTVDSDTAQSVISIYTGSCGAFSNRACHNVSSDGVARAQVAVNLGTTYTIEVGRGGTLVADPAPTTTAQPGFVNISFAPDPCRPDVVPPVLTVPGRVSVVSCQRSASVTVGQATATDNCPGTTMVKGSVVATNGVALTTPIPVTAGKASLPFGTHTVLWTATDAMNNVATANQTVVLRPAVEAGQSYVLADRGTSILTSTGLPAAIVNAGTTLTQLGNDARSADVISVAQVRLFDRVAVAGSIISGGTVTLGQNDNITGSVTPGASVTLPPLPVLPAIPTSATTDISVTQDTAPAPQPGSYRTVTVSGGTLPLLAGDYFFQSLTINPGGTVRVNSATRIFVRTTLIYRSALLAPTGTALQPIVLGFAGTTAALEAPFSGTFVAPAATVMMGVGAGLTFSGSYYIRSLQLQPGSNIACSEVSPPFGN